MQIIIVGIFFAIGFLMLFLSKFNITPQYLLISVTLLFTLGLYETADDLYWLYYIILVLVFIVCSYIPYKHLNKLKSINNCKEEKIYRFNKPFFYTIILFIVYHYVVGGIPILSDSVEISRFDNTSSGLFGIPGRMALYGKLFILFYSCYFVMNDKYSKKKHKKYFIIAIVVNVMCAVFTGSKSSVIALLDFGILVASFFPRNINIKKFFKPKIVIPIVLVFFAGVYYAQYFFARYNNQFSAMNFWSYVYYRSTTLTVEGGDYILRKCHESISFFTDFIYYFSKYFHLGIASEPSLEVYISCAINYFTYTDPYAFYVPITIGGILELIYHFGLFAFIPIGAIGVYYGNTYNRLKICKNPIKYMNYCFLIWFINDYIMKGNLAYHVVNYFLIVAIINGMEYGFRYIKPNRT